MRNKVNSTVGFCFFSLLILNFLLNVGIPGGGGGQRRGFIKKMIFGGIQVVSVVGGFSFLVF